MHCFLIYQIADTKHAKVEDCINLYITSAQKYQWDAHQEYFLQVPKYYAYNKEDWIKWEWNNIYISNILEHLSSTLRKIFIDISTSDSNLSILQNIQLVPKKEDNIRQYILKSFEK